MPTFRFATLLVMLAAISGICSIIRGLVCLDLASVVLGVGAFFAIFVFAEDIWKWLPR